MTPPAEAVVKERLSLGAVVSAAGGFMDSFSYLLHGGVFANGQTGNYVLLSLCLTRRDWLGALSYLVPIVAFVAGIVVARHVRSSRCGGDRFAAQRYVAALEAAAFCALALVSNELPDLVANSAVSFLAAVSYQTFKQFGTKSAYSGVFITGNLRSLGNSLYDGLVAGSIHERHRAVCYLAIIGSFGGGVALGWAMVACMGHHSCLVIAVLFLVARRLVLRQG